MNTKYTSTMRMRIYSCFAFVWILSIFNGSELFSATTWIGTDGVATSAANWSNGLPTTTNGAILNGTGGTVSSTLNFGNTAFNALDLAVSNYSGDVILERVEHCINYIVGIDVIKERVGVHIGFLAGFRR